MIRCVFLNLCIKIIPTILKLCVYNLQITSHEMSLIFVVTINDLNYYTLIYLSNKLSKSFLLMSVFVLYHLALLRA